MSENKTPQKLNPQARLVEIGVRKIREVMIYPLAFASQLEMTDLITKAVQEFFAKREELETGPDIEVVSFAVGTIRENIKRILALVSDEEDLLKDVTNLQLVDIVTVIYEMNYEAISKNAKSLFEKIAGLLPSKRPLPRSVKSTRRTGSKISTKKRSKKAASPSDK